MDTKHVNILKKIGKPNENRNKVDWSEYRKHPLISKLNLTDDEFKQFLGPIIKMINDEKSITSNSALFCIRLVRNELGKIEVLSVPQEQKKQIIQVRHQYLIHDFADEAFNLLLTPQHIGKLVSPSKRELLNHYSSLIHESIIKYGIYVYGEMGIGKTYTMIALANELAFKNKTIAFVFIPDVVLKLKQGFGQDNWVNIEYIDKMKTADVLFLDDIGAEEVNLWFYHDYLLNILNYRMQNHKLTFFNSNLSLNDYRKKLMSVLHKDTNVDRLLERIKSLTNNVEFELKGQNLRYPTGNK